MDFPRTAKLRRRLIAFGGRQPATLRDFQPRQKSRAGAFATTAASVLWSAVCQIDPRAFAAFGVPVFTVSVDKHSHIADGVRLARSGKLEPHRQAAPVKEVAS